VLVPAEFSQQAAPQTDGGYAGFWIRFVAHWIDIIILSVLSTPLSQALSKISVSLFWEKDTVIVSIVMISALFGIGYFTILDGNYGATLGKRILNLRVVNADGKTAGVVRAFSRSIYFWIIAVSSYFTLGFTMGSSFGSPGPYEWVGAILYLADLVLLLGYLMIAFDQKKQGLHDKIAGTYVVKVK